MSRTLISCACLTLAAAASGQCTPEWIEKEVSGPSARVNFAGVYNPTTERMVIFGGWLPWVLEEELGDTWEWDGAAWELMADTGPSPRENYAMQFEPSTGHVVLHGGAFRYPFATYQDTWVWDGSTWALASMSGPTLSFHASAVDPITGEVMIFGGTPESFIGCNENVEYLDDTWAWEGSSWRLVSSDGPPPRGYATMCLDEARGRVVLFGGRNCSVDSFGDTWEWDGASWTQRFPAHSPPPRWYSASTYDRARQRVVLVGGGDSAGHLLGDTWSWDGTDWTLDTDSSPGPRAQFALAYGEGLGGCVLFGGSDDTGYAVDETWLYACQSECYPDFTNDGTLDMFDFLVFGNLFNFGSDFADCDHNGDLDLFDFLCFTNAFNAGCPQ